MTNFTSIDKIQDILIKNNIVFYMNWEEWRIEIDLKDFLISDI